MDYKMIKRTLLPCFIYLFSLSALADIDDAKTFLIKKCDEWMNNKALVEKSIANNEIILTGIFDVEYQDQISYSTDEEEQWVTFSVKHRKKINACKIDYKLAINKIINNDDEIEKYTFLGNEKITIKIKFGENPFEQELFYNCHITADLID